VVEKRSTVSIVWPCPVDVDGYVEGAHAIEVPRPACPRCSGATLRWHGYHRHLRDDRDRDRLIWIHRVRCRECGVTQALLPWFVLPWRWDAVEVIGQAIELAAAGHGHRRIAIAVGRSVETVRSWLRRARKGSAEIARQLLAKAVEWGWSDWEAATAGLPRLWSAVLALAEQWRRRREDAGVWAVTNLVSGGRLLATNRTSPLEGDGAWGWMAVKSNPEVPDDS
jgi:hypothetical protein